MTNEFPEFIDPVQDCPWRPPREIFARLGFFPVNPSDLDDLQLPGRLLELLYAAAARRLFFFFTDHLSDRELYSMLWRHWLDAPIADIPPEARTNIRVDVSEWPFEKLTARELHLKYYAGNADYPGQDSRRDEQLQRREKPPFDRDRFLPVPPEDLLAGPSEDAGLTPEEREAHLEAELEACEPDNWIPAADTLVEQNVPLLPPAEVTDEAIESILWELLHNLALRGFYVLSTDHLSDRQLYEALWHHGLREPACLSGRGLSGFFHDFIGSGSEEDIHLWLRHYADDEARKQFAAEWPDQHIPPQEKAPFNRDWRLPKAPFG